MESIENLVILGAGSDVTSRLLLPGLGSLLVQEPHRRIRLVGLSRHSDLPWRETVRDAFDAVEAGGPAVDDAIARAEHREVDATDGEALSAVLQQLDGASALYFALPPAVTERALEALADVGVPEGTVLALEKPIGDDLESAQRLGVLAAQVVPASSIFRVDHFLGLPPVLNFLGLRFANRWLEPLLNREHVERIDVTYDESLGLEGRADFYDSTGALRDMIQSHLMQVLGVVMMEPPSSFDQVEIPALIAHVLRATHVWDAQGTTPVLRGRYTAGEVDGKQMPAYRDEEGVDPGRETETFAQVTLEVDTWRWNGVPVTLRSGKAIGSPRQEIAITFRRPPHTYRQFPHDGDVAPSVLRIGLGHEHVSFEVNAGGPFDSRGMTRATMSSTMPQPGLTAYGVVARGVLDRDPTFFVRQDAAEDAWRITEDVLALYDRDDVPLHDYPAGSDGPA